MDDVQPPAAPPSTYEGLPAIATALETAPGHAVSCTVHDTTFIAALPTMTISKAESKAMCKKLVNGCSSLTESRTLVAKIMHSYQGRGAFPLKAAMAMEIHQRAFDDAMDIMFATINKASEYLGRDMERFWTSIRRRKGTAWRFFKYADFVLSATIFHHFLLRTKASTEADWDVLLVVDRISAFWDALVARMPPPSSHAKYTGPHRSKPRRPLFGKPMAFPRSLIVLRVVHARVAAVIRVNKISGDFMPQEVKNMIADILKNTSGLLGVTEADGLKAANLDGWLATVQIIYSIRYWYLPRITKRIPEWSNKTIKRRQSL